MKLLIRDYLAKLGESGELDVLVADLLLNMQIEPLSKPQRGVRQDGVDIAAVGTDPEDGVRKLFLITIKAGDVTRGAWDGNPNAVRPSLNEIKDVYLTKRIARPHRKLPKKVVLCCARGSSSRTWKTAGKGIRMTRASLGIWSMTFGLATSLRYSLRSISWTSTCCLLIPKA